VTPPLSFERSRQPPGRAGTHFSQGGSCAPYRAPSGDLHAAASFLPLRDVAFARGQDLVGKLTSDVADFLSNGGQIEKLGNKPFLRITPAEGTPAAADAAVADAK